MTLKILNVLTLNTFILRPFYSFVWFIYAFANLATVVFSYSSMIALSDQIGSFPSLKDLFFWLISPDDSYFLLLKGNRDEFSPFSLSLVAEHTHFFLSLYTSTITHYLGETASMHTARMTGEEETRQASPKKAQQLPLYHVFKIHLWTC